MNNDADLRVNPLESSANLVPDVDGLHPASPALVGGGGEVGKGFEMELLGNEATEKAAQILYGHLGLSITADWAEATPAIADAFLWSGSVKDSAREYWTPNLYDTRKIVAKLASSSMDDPEWWMGDRRLGIGNAEILCAAAAFFEIDHLSLEEQRARYDWLYAQTGLVPALEVFSGRKSIHGYVSFSRPLYQHVPDDEILRKEIQFLLIAILEGDWHIRDLARLMRRPGWDGDRKQPIIALNDVHYEPEDVRDRLRILAESIGIVDVHQAFRNLKLADDLNKIEGSKGLQDAIRFNRANLPPELQEQADLLLGRLRQMRAAGSRIVATGGSSTLLLLEQGGLSEFRGLAKGTRVNAPCCSQRHSSADANTQNLPDEPVRLYCYRCTHTLIERTELDQNVILLDGESYRVQVSIQEVLDSLESEIQEESQETILSENAEPSAAVLELQDLEARAAASVAKERQLVAIRALIAASLDPAVIEAAAAAKHEALTHRDDLRDLYALSGATQTLKWKDLCGFRLGITDVFSYQIGVVGKNCGSYDCYMCGPVLLALKAVGAAMMPLLDRQDRQVGLPLDQQKLFVHRFPREYLNAWLHRFHKIAGPYNPEGYKSYGAVESIGKKTIDSTAPQVGQVRAAIADRVEAAFVSFESADASTITAVTNVALPVQRRGKNRIQWEAPSVLEGQALIRSSFMSWTLNSYEIGIDPVDRKFHARGKITSSTNLTLNPKDLLKKAAIHNWVVTERYVRPVTETKRIWSKAGIHLEPQPKTEGQGVAITVPVTEPAERERLWAMVRAEAPAKRETAQTKAAKVAAIEAANDAIDNAEDIPVNPVTKRPIMPAVVLPYEAPPPPKTQAELDAIFEAALAA